MLDRPRRLRARAPALAPDPTWYKTAIVYEVHVRAFYDSNGDGIGDLPGLTSRLDYLQDLGVTALWLLPFYPSPLRDGGYDIADYTSINPAYGTIDDFRRFLDEAHRRGIRVITELVLNHTSTDHAWFQRARRAPPGSPERDFYVWSDTAERYASARIIFKDFETSNWAWDPVAHAYYWHRFYAHQPDLNFDNPAVHEAMTGVVDFWLELGVDGLRLDAVPYLYEREGTSCENLLETHAFLKKLRAHVDGRFRDRMLLAEANQWPADAAQYFGDGDECHMNFHFPLMPRMFMAVQMEDSFPIVDVLRQTPTLPAPCQWATFLRNHDEMTLEMVTDEERDYMYRVYTEDPVARINLGIRRRLAPLLRSRRKIELMNALLFSLPGTPVLYYGDEIGMGDNVYLGDRDGVRTPMQWSGDRNAGFSKANPQRLYLPVIIDPEYHYESLNVEAQQQNPSSLLWWQKRIIDMRKQHPAMSLGGLEMLSPENARVLAFVREGGGERILVVANLSRYPQHVELDLARHAGSTPVEMFGKTPFPAIGDRPYPLALGRHGFYWFVLEPPPGASAERKLRSFSADESWTEVLSDQRLVLARSLADYVAQRRWFRGKARTRRAARIVDVVELHRAHEVGHLVLVEIEYASGEPETYVVPLAFVTGEALTNLEQTAPQAIVAHVDVGGPPPTRGAMIDTLATGDAAAALCEVLGRRADGEGEHGHLVATAQPSAIERCGDGLARMARLEQTNTTVPMGDRLLFKVFRQIEPGINAELEVGEYLSKHAPRGLVPQVLGSISYAGASREPAALAVIHEFIPNQGTAWDLYLRDLGVMFDRLVAHTGEVPAPPPAHVLDLAGQAPPPELAELAAVHLRRSRRLGERTAELHATLAAGLQPGFEPEPFTPMHQQSLYQGARALLVRTGEGLRRRLSRLPEAARAEATALLEAQPQIEARLRGVTSRLIPSMRIRSHGDLHLGQVLATGEEFVFIDFEGEPGRPLSERRFKRCPLRDVAGMLRSFSYAVESVLREGRQRPQDEDRLRRWAALWAAWVSAACVTGYLANPAVPPLLPRDPRDRRELLDFYMLEKCIYEIGYELNNRPEWLAIPVRGLLALATRPA